MAPSMESSLARFRFFNILEPLCEVDEFPEFVGFALMGGVGDKTRCPLFEEY